MRRMAGKESVCVMQCQEDRVSAMELFPEVQFSVTVLGGGGPDISS